MYIAMLETYPATGGPTSSKEEEGRLFHSLAVDTNKLFLSKSELLSVGLYPGKQGYT